MQHGRPDVRELKAGTLLTQQGEEATDLYVILDGMVSVEVDGRELGDLGPGAVVGERALLEGGRRTATLRAVTPGRVAVVAGAAVSRDALRRLTEDHRREDLNDDGGA
jgi:CRP-like cAMP-binding protein